MKGWAISKVILLYSVSSLKYQVLAFVVPLRRSAKCQIISPKFNDIPFPPILCENANGSVEREDDKAVAINPNNCSASGTDCDLGAAFERELEEGQARRNAQLPKFQQPTFLELAVNGALDLIFVRRQNSARLRKMFVTKRSYAKNETFSRSQLSNPPLVEDLLPYPTPIEESFYLSVPAAILTFLTTAAVFPFLAGLMVDFVDIPPNNLNDINSKLVPGVSILYGTFMSLTLSILYNRQRQVQDSVAQETSLLSFLLHNMCFLFKRDRSRLVRAGQVRISMNVFDKHKKALSNSAHIIFSVLPIKCGYF